MVLCWQWLWRYLLVALLSYTTLSSGCRRFRIRENVISQNDFVFTVVYVEACSGNQRVMEPPESSRTLCMIYITNLLITWSYVDNNIWEIHFLSIYIYLAVWGKMSLFHSWYLATDASEQTPTKRAYKCLLKPVNAMFTYYWFYNESDAY